MIQELRASLVVLIFFTLLTGLAYPVIVTVAGELAFPHQASGSLVEKDGKIIGSELIGQKFTSDVYFHGRPSAAGDGYDAANSSGSNLAPTAPDLVKTIGERVAELRADGNTRPVPVDLVTASGSGLDPDISVAAAYYQAARVAQARGIPQIDIEKLIDRSVIPRSFGVLGEPHVNVLALNRALDMMPGAPQ